MIDLSNVQVVTKSPARGYSIQTLIVEAALVDPLAAPNGLLLGCLGWYTPGTALEYFPVPKGTGFENFLRLHDFTLEPSGLLLVSYWGKPGARTDVTLTSQVLQFVPNVKKVWDFFLIAFNLSQAPGAGAEFARLVESIRTALIVRSALEVL